jgi:hypothetical protein
MTSSSELRDILLAAIAPLPTVDGGPAIILATAGPPPTITPLSTGDIAVTDDTVRLALFADNSAVKWLGGSCTILVPTEKGPLRVSLQSAIAREAGPLAVIEGNIVSLRPSAEPPWSLRLGFEPTAEEGREAYVRYWTEVRSWLERGALGAGPELPPRSTAGRT